MTVELTKLYNTMLLVETRGESTKIMADCIRFVEHLIKKSKEENEKE